MSITWDARPDDFEVSQLVATTTPDGLPCQVIARIVYLVGGNPVGKKDMAISPGWVARYFPSLSEEERKAKFLELYNSIPQVSQAVLDAVKTKMPEEAVKDIWGY